MYRLLSVFALALIALSFGCRGALEQEPGNVQVTLALNDSALEIVETRQVGELPNPPLGDVGQQMQFIFHPEDGSAPVEGEIADNRVLRSEFDLSGQPDYRQVLSNTGLFSVRVPSAVGRLELRTPDGDDLGSVLVDPDQPITRQAALMRQEDLIGGPVKVVDQGPRSAKADILFLPEGYTESEMASFHRHVNEIVTQLSRQSGYRQHWDGFNIWRQDIRSRTRGTGSSGQPLDTAFETASGISGLERCVYFANSRGLEAARSIGRQIGADATVVLVNSTAHGGCAGEGVVVSSRPRHVADIVAHELAHGLFGLADEYESPRTSGNCSTGPNVSSSPTRLPWADLVNTNQLPTSPNASFGTVGAFEGAGYCARGRYRPTHNCMMRSLGTGMCQVCRREVARTMAALAPGDATTTNAASVEVTNRTGGDLWVRCNGNVRSTCSDWEYLRDGQSAAVKTPNRELVLHNVDLPSRVTFDLRRVTAPSNAVSVHASVSNPFSSPGSSTGNGGSTSGGTTSTSSIETPRNLTPDLSVVTNTEVTLRWEQISGAANYRVTVQRESNGSWQSFGAAETTGTAATVVVRPEGGRYRWNVQACSGSNCARSHDAIFTYQGSTTGGTTTGGTTSGGGTTTGSAPPTPGGLRPSDQTVVSDGSPSLKWNAVNGATQYNFKMLYQDGTTWRSYVPEQTVAGTAVSTTLQMAETWYAFTVQACNGSGCSDWSEHSRVYFRP